MIYLFYVIHVVICLFLILVVLLQQGKGADLSVFGGGGTMTAFGARGAASLLHKFTVGGFVLFIVTTLAIGVFQSRTSDSVMSGLPTSEEAAATATEGEDAGEAGEEDTGEAEVDGILPEAEEFDSALPETEPGLSPADEGQTPESSEGESGN